VPKRHSEDILLQAQQNGLCVSRHVQFLSVVSVLLTELNYFY